MNSNILKPEVQKVDFSGELRNVSAANFCIPITDKKLRGSLRIGLIFAHVDLTGFPYFRIFVLKFHGFSNCYDEIIFTSR
jgi:hypothetical protein